VSLWVIWIATLILVESPLPVAEPAAPLKPAAPLNPTSVAPTPQIRQTTPVALEDAVETRNWNRVLELVSTPKADSLQALLRARALFELDKFSDLLSEPAIEDPRFKSYFEYLKMSAAHQLKKFELVLNAPTFDDLPEAILQSAAFLRSQSLISLERWAPAKASLREFIKKYPRSGMRSDALLELAQIEWKLENKFEALHLYEEIYSQYPLSDSNDTAGQKLREAGKFQELDAGVHLLRADQLKRAALFNKGIQELKKLISIVQPKDQSKVQLALAGLEFSKRDYAGAQAAATTALKSKTLDPGLRLDWQSLLGRSLVRQGKYDEARPVYQELLQSKISSWEKENIQLRLGLMALDDQNFKDSAQHFKRLRVDHLRGRFQETAHWFEAWALYQVELRALQKSPGYKVDSASLESAATLLDRLPKLPEGERLKAQALYWQVQIYGLLKDEVQKTRAEKKLEKHWKASFHSELNTAKPFDFLTFNSIDITEEVKDKHKPPTLIDDAAFQELSWRRVEAFASIKLSNWARLELDRFRLRLGLKNAGLRNAIAYRLRDLGDWHDLVVYAKTEFPFELEDLEIDDPVSRFHYPQAFLGDVLKASKEFEISPFLIWGVMREESRFQADVLSGAGAVGLLQLMPNLGDRIAKNLKEKPTGRAGLTDSAKNIRYGVFHLKELIDRVASLRVPEEFRYPLVVAAYNAGFGPVKNWVETLGTDRVDIFVESIPYTETRNYVKRVLQSANVYYRLYGERVRTLSKSKEEKNL